MEFRSAALGFADRDGADGFGLHDASGANHESAPAQTDFRAAIQAFFRRTK